MHDLDGRRDLLAVEDDAGGDTELQQVGRVFTAPSPWCSTALIGWFKCGCPNASAESDNADRGRAVIGELRIEVALARVVYWSRRR
jgi:hypothetical protein